MNKKIFKQILFSYLPRLASFIVGPIILALLTKNLSVKDYGVFTVFRDTCYLLMFILSFGLNKYIANFIPGKNKNEQLSIYKTIFSIEFFLFFFITTISLFFFKELFLSWLNIKGYIKEFIIFILAFNIYIFYLENINFLGYQKKIEKKSLYAFFEKVLYFFFVLIAVKLKLDLLKLSIVFLVLHILLAIFSAYSVNILAVIKAKFDKKIIKQAFYFSLPLTVTEIGWRIMRNFDRYILSSNNYLDEVGIYAFIFKYIELAYLVGSPIIWVIYPYLVESYNKGKKKEVEQFSENQFRFSFVIILYSLYCLVNLRDIIVPIISKADYLIFPEIYFYMCFPIIFIVFIYILQQILILKGKGKFLGLAYVVTTLLNVLLNILYIPEYGIKGAVFSTIFSLFFLVIFIKYKVSYYVNIKYLYKYWIFIVFTMVYIYNTMYLNSIKLKFISFLIFTALYLFIILKFKFLSIEKIKKIFRKGKNE